MGIADADVARVRAATDLAALVGEHTALRRVGRRFAGLCPFHSEKTASFSVNAEEGLYHCFGCQRSGDAITFVREIEHCGFVEAVERLAARAGLSIEVTDDPVVRAERQQRQRLSEVLARAVDWYHGVLLEAPEGGPARQYLRSRGYDGEVVRRFRLGYAPDRGDALVRALGGAGVLLVEAGLAFSGQGGRERDVFRERVIFPIFDPGGRAIALGGRILPDGLRRRAAGRAPADPGPKYRNSAESALYSKRRTLYGLNWAKNEIAHSGEVVVCEGYTDVIGCFQAGVERAVATCGTALTEEHVKQLANFAEKRIVLCFDADAAGQNAAARLYEWERRHDVEVAVAALPPGSDPGELAQRDRAALAEAIAGARPFLGFVVERALAGGDLSSTEGRARAAGAALEAIAEHPGDLVRDQYLLQVADRTRFEHDQLRRQLEALRARGPRLAGGPPAGRAAAADHAAAGTRSEHGRTGRPTPQRRSEEPPSYDEPDDDEGDGWPARGAPRPGRGDLASSPAGGSRARASQPRPARAAPVAPRAGRDVLLYAVHAPGELAGLLEKAVLDPALFSDALQRHAFEALLAAEQLHDAIAAAEAEVAELLIELAVGEPPEGTTAEDAVLALAHHAAGRLLARAGADARLAEASDDATGHARANTDSRMLHELLVPLRDPVEAPEGAARTAAAALVAWLTQQPLEV